MGILAGLGRFSSLTLAKSCALTVKQPPKTDRLQIILFKLEVGLCRFQSMILLN